MKRYNPSEIEEKWQKIWEKGALYSANDNSTKPKKYIAGQFPYPSATGLHAGHTKVYTIVDAVARFYRQNGYEVLSPMGWDTFGMPAENYAIKTGISPQVATKENIASFKHQFKKLGISIDWKREINTSHPDYYRWTQWIFQQLYKNDLAYRAENYQWWCPLDQTVLANEQVESGKCWRCGSEVEKKKMRQWFFRITKYAEELLAGLDNLDWPESVKSAQRNWIGKSVGAEIDFEIEDYPHFIDERNPVQSDKELTKRRVVQVFVHDPKTDKYLFVKWKKFPWTSCVLGGIKDDEDIETAARREVLEETGYKNLKFERILGKYRAEFFAANKDANRDTDATQMLFTLENNERSEMTDKEIGIQEPIWLSPDEVKKDDFPAYDETILGFERINGKRRIRKITTFTTRPDTIFGATFLVLAPEHPLVGKITTNDRKREVERYRAAAMKKSEIERQENREKTGVFTGAFAINPASGKKIPIWTADYVMMGYGTGAIMAVPAHDERDYEFAKKFDIPIKQVVAPSFGEVRENEVDVRGAIVIGYNPKTQKFLAMETKNGDLKWRLPSGSFDESDANFTECARRELKEETGHDLSYEKFIKLNSTPISSHYFNSIKKSYRNSWSSAFLAIIEGENTTNSAPEIHEEDFKNVWLEFDDLVKYYQNVPDKNVDHWIYILNLAQRTVKNNYELVTSDVVFTNEGLLINSGEFDGIESSIAREKIVKYLSQKNFARFKTTYKMRDWLISRQRYWGAPIPIAYDKNDKEHLIPEEDLPVILPKIDDYKPDNSGRSALAKSSEFTKVIIDGEEMTRETDTMDGFACSSWYLLRYADPRNHKKAWNSKRVNFWNPVDYYVGADHSTTHMLYVRMWTMFFRDIGLTDFTEPILKFVKNGNILATDGTKMSKSKGNTIDPLEVINSGYGADTLRTYILFMVPPDLDAAWSLQGLGGVHRFLSRVWNLAQEFVESKVKAEESSDELNYTIQKTIKKVTLDIKNDGFNTAIAALMECLNNLYKLKENGFSEQWREVLSNFALLLAPFAPHLAAEIFENLGNRPMIEEVDWPKWDEKYLKTDSMKIAVQVNGKLRGEVVVPTSISQEEIEKLALEHENVAKFVGSQSPKKIIYVPSRLINVVV